MLSPPTTQKHEGPRVLWWRTAHNNPNSPTSPKGQWHTKTTKSWSGLDFSQENHRGQLPHMLQLTRTLTAISFTRKGHLFDKCSLSICASRALLEVLGMVKKTRKNPAYIELRQWQKERHTYKISKICNILHWTSAKRRVKQVKGIKCGESKILHRKDGAVCTNVACEEDLSLSYLGAGLWPLLRAGWEAQRFPSRSGITWLYPTGLLWLLGSEDSETQARTCYASQKIKTINDQWELRKTIPMYLHRNKIKFLTKLTKVPHTTNHQYGKMGPFKWR